MVDWHENRQSQTRVCRRVEFVGTLGYPNSWGPEQWVHTIPFSTFAADRHNTQKQNFATAHSNSHKILQYHRRFIVSLISSIIVVVRLHKHSAILSRHPSQYWRFRLSHFVLWQTMIAQSMAKFHSDSTIMHAWHAIPLPHVQPNQRSGRTVPTKPMHHHQKVHHGNHHHQRKTQTIFRCTYRAIFVALESTTTIPLWIKIHYGHGLKPVLTVCTFPFT